MVVWGVFSLLCVFCHFVCICGYRFLSGRKYRGVRFCMQVRLLSTMSFSPLVNFGSWGVMAVVALLPGEWLQWILYVGRPYGGICVLQACWCTCCIFLLMCQNVPCCWMAWHCMGLCWYRARVVHQDDKAEPNWRGAQWDLSQSSYSSPAQKQVQSMQSIPATTSSTRDIPVIKFNAAQRSGLSAYSYGPPRLASPVRRPLLN